MHGIKHCGYKSLSDMLADQNNMDGASENTEATNSQLWFHFLDKLYFIMSTIIPKKQTKQADSSDVLPYFHIKSTQKRFSLRFNQSILIYKHGLLMERNINL